MGMIYLSICLQIVFYRHNQPLLLFNFSNFFGSCAGFYLSVWLICRETDAIENESNLWYNYMIIRSYGGMAHDK